MKLDLTRIVRRDGESLRPSEVDQVNSFLRRDNAQLLKNAEYKTGFAAEDMRIEVLLVTILCPGDVISWLLRYSPGKGSKNDYATWFEAIAEFKIPNLDRRLVGALAIYGAASAATATYEYDSSPQARVKSWLTDSGFDFERLWGLFLLLHRESSDAAIQLKISHDLDSLIADHPTVLAEALPWLIAQPSRGKDAFVLAASLEHTSVLDALQSIASCREYSPIGERSQGLWLQVSGDGTPRAQAKLWAREQELFKCPGAVTAPTSTWWGDHGLEAGLRSAIARAAQGIKNHGMTSEVMITGAFLSALQIRLEGLNEIVLAGSARNLTVSYTAPSNTDEKKNGSDVVIIINLRGQSLSLRRAHFIQAKATKDGKTPQWSIKIEQLRDLLATDQTATFWLIGPFEEKTIYVVPAAYLEARAAAIIRQSKNQRSFTVQYSDIKDVATDVAQEMVDFVIGLWIGTSSTLAIEYVDESSPSRSLAHVLTISIRDGDY